MGLFTRSKTKTQNSDVGVTYISVNSPGVLAGHGYHRLSDAPEVAAAVWLIADVTSA